MGSAESLLTHVDITLLPLSRDADVPSPSDSVKNSVVKDSEAVGVQEAAERALEEGQVAYHTDEEVVGVVQGHFLTNGISPDTRAEAVKLARHRYHRLARLIGITAETRLRHELREQDIAFESLLTIWGRLSLPVEECDLGIEYF